MAKQPKKENSEKKIEELENQLKRALADYQNLERRVAQERQDFKKLAAAIVIVKFLPILDNLKKAAMHLSDSGLNMLISQFDEVLKSEGVEEIKIKKGDLFNPELTEAIEIVKGPKDGQIIEVLQAGYTLSGKLLRPAQVKVAKKEITEKDKKVQQQSQFGDYV